MTDSEYNCFSCKNSECKFHETQKPVSYLGTPISSIIQIFTSDKGCVSHSSRPHTSTPASMPQFTPYIPGKEEQNTYRCCEVCPNVPCKPLFRVNCIRNDPATIRNATLDGVSGKIWEKTITPYPAVPDYHVVAWDTIKEIVESLRTQPQDHS